MAKQREKSVRLFVAVELPDAWLAALGDLQDELRDRLGSVRLRWVRPESVHLTLKFIGHTALSLVPAIETALNGAAAALPAIRLELEGLGTFGDRGIPRVVWVGLDGDIEPLRSLAGRIDVSLRPLGIPAERRPLAPHLTLARVPEGFSRTDAAALSAALAAVRAPSAPPLAVSSISLILSRLGPGGARYERLASLPAASSTTGKPLFDASRSRATMLQASGWLPVVSARGQKRNAIRVEHADLFRRGRRDRYRVVKKGFADRFFFHLLVLIALAVAAGRLIMPGDLRTGSPPVSAASLSPARVDVSRSAAPVAPPASIVDPAPSAPIFRNISEAAPLASSRLAAAASEGLRLAEEAAQETSGPQAATPLTSTHPPCDSGQSPLYCVYTVDDGDTLGKIATKFGLKSSGDIANWDLLVYSNRPDIASAEDLIQPGQKVRIPNDTGVVALVLGSQSAAQFARGFGVTASDITGASGPLAADQALATGTELLVRNPSQLGSTAAASTASSASATSSPTATASATPTAAAAGLTEPRATATAASVPAALSTATTLPTAATTAPPAPTTAPATPVRTATAPILSSGTAVPTPARKTGFIWPATGPISSRFGPSHPLGIDIDLFNNTNAKIAAAAAGTVTFAGGNPCCSYGLYVVVDHGNGYTTLYAHLSQLSVVAGQKVNQGDLLGLGGKTGYATGIHLHFEVHYNGSVIDPAGVLP